MSPGMIKKIDPQAAAILFPKVSGCKSIPSQVGEAWSLRGFAEFDVVMVAIPFHHFDHAVVVDCDIPSNTPNKRHVFM